MEKKYKVTFYFGNNSFVSQEFTEKNLKFLKEKMATNTNFKFLELQDGNKEIVINFSLVKIVEIEEVKNGETIKQD